ncbi:MAG: phytochelatin synthase family protein [Vitreimonas sp.]
MTELRRTAAALAALAALTLGACEGRPELAQPSRAVAASLIPLDSAEGQRLLFASEAHAAFLPLVSHFENQVSLSHCGPATLAMVLNAIEAPAPAPRAYAPYRLFTQENVLNGRTREIVSDGGVARAGMALQQVADVLGVYGLDVETHYASASSLDAFRAQALDYLGRDDRHVIVNYSRSALGQSGPGHISPLAAYDAESDRFLILDTSRYKAPPVWVRADALFAAMAEPILVGGRTRGFLLVRKPSGERS